MHEWGVWIMGVTIRPGRGSGGEGDGTGCSWCTHALRCPTCLSSESIVFGWFKDIVGNMIVCDAAWALKISAIDALRAV